MVAERDELGDAAAARPRIEAMAEPRELHVVAGADHAFNGCLPDLEALVASIGSRLARGAA